MTSSGVSMRGIRAEDLIDIRDQVVVREHDALGQSGGAAGVGKRGDGFLRVLASFREFGGRFAEPGRSRLAKSSLLEVKLRVVKTRRSAGSPARFTFSSSGASVMRKTAPEFSS